MKITFIIESESLLSWNYWYIIVSIYWLVQTESDLLKSYIFTF